MKSKDFFSSVGLLCGIGVAAFLVYPLYERWRAHVRCLGAFEGLIWQQLVQKEALSLHEACDNFHGSYPPAPFSRLEE